MPSGSGLGPHPSKSNLQLYSLAGIPLLPREILGKENNMPHDKSPHKSRKSLKRIKAKYGVCKTCVFRKHKRKKRQHEDHKPGVPQSEKKKALVKFLGGKCDKCGYDRCIAALSFHHKDQNDKVFTISAYLSLPMEDLIEEVKKCRLLCLNCHSELHYGTVETPEAEKPETPPVPPDV